MSECTICNVCESPGTFQNAREVQKVFSHVRCFSKDSFTVWRCMSCGSLHSKEDVDLPKYYADYPFKKHRLDYHTKIAYKNRLQLLKKAGFSEKHSLLDYGCGQGLYVDFLRARGYSDAQGFDPYSERFSNAGVLRRQYDIITSHDVIEHVDDPKAYLRELVSMVRPGGFLVIGTPNASEISLSKNKLTTVELSQPYHRHILSREALFSLSKEAGLSPVHVYDRFYFDSLYPMVNVRFMWSYIEKTGGMIDVAVESPDPRVILCSPKLIFYALFGYFFRVPGNILVTFRRAAVQTESEEEPTLATAVGT